MAYLIKAIVLKCQLGIRVLITSRKVSNKKGGKSKRGFIWITLTCIMVISLAMASCSSSTTTSSQTSTTATTATTSAAVTIPTTSNVVTTSSAATTSETTAVTTTSTGNWWDTLGTPQYGGTLNIQISTDPTNFDPYYNRVLETIQAGWMERLFADNWTVNPTAFDYQMQYRGNQWTTGQLAQSWEFTNPNTFVVHYAKMYTGRI